MVFIEGIFLCSKQKNNKEEILLMLRLMKNAYGLLSNIDQCITMLQEILVTFWRQHISTM